jgi:hypothetical protein
VPRLSAKRSNDAAEAMRWGIEHQYEARAIGDVGRLDIESRFSRAAVAQIVVDRVSDITRRLDAKVRKFATVTSAHITIFWE